MDLLDKIIQELEPYKDKVVISPLTENEIEQIQSKYKKKLPKYFINFLRKIGLKQDLVWEVFDNISDFKDLGEFLPSEDYFQFGNRSEDYWLLKFENEDDRNIYEYEFYKDGEIKSINKTFDEFLLEGLKVMKERYEEFLFNDLKVWAVQFSINTGSGDFLVKQLKDKVDFDIQLISKPTYKKTTDAGTKCYEGEISINGKIILLKKYILSGYGSSNLYFDWQESIEDMHNNSLIKKLDRALKQCVFKYTLLDYGILNKEAFE